MNTARRRTEGKPKMYRTSADSNPGLIEIIALRFGFVAAIGLMITLVRAWGDWETIGWAAGAAMLASPLGLVLAAVVLLPLSQLIGGVTAIEANPRIGQQFVALFPVLGVFLSIGIAFATFI